jgi:hypothetical protein
VLRTILSSYSAERRSRRSRLFIIVVAAALGSGVVVIATTLTKSHRAAPRAEQVFRPSSDLYRIAPDGKGDCVAQACRTIDSAVARAKADHAAGAVIELAAGSYDSQTISDRSKTPTLKRNIVVEPMPGASVEIGSIDLNSSNVTLHKLVVTGSIRLGTGAVASGLDDVRTRAGTVYLGASRSFVTNSFITPATDSDGIQVKAYKGANPDGVRIEGTTIGPTHRGPKRGHVDCIQILGGKDVTVRYNRLFHCASQGIISSVGASGRISGTIDVERNEIELCPERTYDCDGHNAVNMTAPRVIFVHNTVIDGGATFKVPDLTVAANYIENLKSCTGVIEANLIASTDCKNLPAGNLHGELTFADVGASPPDLTPSLSVLLPGGDRWVRGTYSRVDINGREVDPAASTVGAVQTTTDVDR